MKLDRYVVGVLAWRKLTNDSDRGASGPSPNFRITSTRNVHKKALSIENAIAMHVFVTAADARSAYTTPLWRDVDV